jgi:hypothetical protein
MSALLRRLTKPEFVEPDYELGLLPDSSCIAFQKHGHDTRSWLFHREF